MDIFRQFLAEAKATKERADGEAAVLGRKTRPLSEFSFPNRKFHQHAVESAGPARSPTTADRPSLVAVRPPAQTVDVPPKTAALIRLALRVLWIRGPPGLQWVLGPRLFSLLGVRRDHVAALFPKTYTMRLVNRLSGNEYVPLVLSAAAAAKTHTLVDLRSRIEAHLSMEKEGVTLFASMESKTPIADGASHLPALHVPSCLCLLPRSPSIWRHLAEGGGATTAAVAFGRPWNYCTDKYLLCYDHLFSRSYGVLVSAETPATEQYVPMPTTVDAVALTGDNLGVAGIGRQGQGPTQLFFVPFSAAKQHGYKVRAQDIVCYGAIPFDAIQPSGQQRVWFFHAASATTFFWGVRQILKAAGTEMTLWCLQPPTDLKKAKPVVRKLAGVIANPGANVPAWSKDRRWLAMGGTGDALNLFDVGGKAVVSCTLTGQSFYGCRITALAFAGATNGWGGPTLAAGFTSRLHDASCWVYEMDATGAPRRSFKFFDKNPCLRPRRILWLSTDDLLVIGKKGASYVHCVAGRDTVRCVQGTTRPGRRMRSVIATCEGQLLVRDGTNGIMDGSNAPRQCAWRQCAWITDVRK
jgi:hypothetical protein